MEEQFIPYEQALELKELGFNDKCFGFYSTKLNNEFKLYQDVLENFHYEYGNIAAPLWQQAFDWFGVKYPLFSCIEDYPFEKGAFMFKIYGKTCYIDPCLELSINYEEVRLECLKKLIEIVKEKI